MHCYKGSRRINVLATSSTQRPFAISVFCHSQEYTKYTLTKGAFGALPMPA